MAADAGIRPVGDEDGAVDADADVDRADPVIGGLQEIGRDAGVAGAGGHRRVGADHVRPRVGVEQRAAERLGEEVALVDADPAGGAAARHEKVGDHAGVALVPLRLLARLTGVGRLVAGPVRALGAHVAEVAAFHDVVDPHALVAVVVVVRLPGRPEGVGRDFIVIPEVVAERLEAGAVGVAAERHALPVTADGAAGATAPLLSLAADLAAAGVDDRLALAVHDARAVAAGIAGIEVEAAVGSEHDRVQPVVAVDAAEAVEEDFGRTGGLVARGIDRVDQHLRRLCDVDLVPDHADAERGEDLLVLGKDLIAVADPGALAVLEDDDAVAFGRQLGLAVVDRLGHPDAAALVDVHAGGVDHSRLAGPGREGQAGRQREGLLDLLGGLHAGLGFVLGEEADDYRGEEKAHAVAPESRIPPML